MLRLSPVFVKPAAHAVRLPDNDIIPHFRRYFNSEFSFAVHMESRNPSPTPIGVGLGFLLFDAGVKSLITADDKAIIAANRNTVGISDEGEPIRCAGFGCKSVPEVNGHAAISCRHEINA